MKDIAAPLFLYSEDAIVPGLPVRCHIAQLLSLGDMKEKAAVIRTDAPVYSDHLSELVVVAKGLAKVTDAFVGETIVGVYVMKLDERAGPESIDLSRGLQPVLDWGALTLSEATAQRNQVR